MSDDFFTREGFEARLTARRMNSVAPSPVAFFYHASLMPGWEPIVAEQMDVFRAAGVDTVKTHVVATSEKDAERFYGIALSASVRLDVLGVSRDFAVYERPTIRAVWDWAKANPLGAAFYCHTKGASAPGDRHKAHWRRVMGKHVIAEWRTNLVHLAVADLVGCAWQESADYPHFCGNFWGARCEWLARLDDPESYRLSRPDFRWAGAHSWRDRMHVETWLGSKGWHHVEDRIGKSVPLWNDRVYGFDASVPGVDYGRSHSFDGVECGQVPVRWWVFDDAFNPAGEGEIPSPDWDGWEARYENDDERHKRTTRRMDATPTVASAIAFMRSDSLVSEWSRRVGYPLVDDPTLHGGGLHVTGPGGKLQTHLDYDRHPLVAGKRRALNLIAFLHPEWRTEWGGSLVLCDPNGKVVKRIEPKPGRLVAFETNDLSYHGVEPVANDCPAERVTAAVYLLSDAGPQNTRTRALFMPDRKAA